MANLITDRIAYFLKDFPPFSFLDVESRESLAEAISVKYVKKSDRLFSEGEENTGFCYILRQGIIKLSQHREDREVLVDECEAGDVFGVRSVLLVNPYSMSAEASDESLVYALPAEKFRYFLENNQRFSLFFASGYAAGQTVVRGVREGMIPSWQIPEENQLEYSENVITCEITSTIQNAAQKMTEAGVGSIIVTDALGLAEGIVTDSDLRTKVVAKGLHGDIPIAQIMSAPVIAVSSNVTVTEVQMHMIESGIHHVLMTEDGTLKTKPKGLVSDHDILLSRLNHPSVLLKSIKNSDDEEKWSELRDKAEAMLTTFLDQDLAINLVSNLISRINDLIVKKAINKAIEELNLHDVQFCWLSLGSEGREEQLLRTDQDNAIVFADSNDHVEIQQKLLALAERVNDVLIHCGFEKCPAEIMARNPKWCQSLSAWKQYFSDWISTADPTAVLNSTIFFDFRAIFGPVALKNELSNHLLAEIGKHSIFLNYLAKNVTQNPPPLSFFKNLVVERSGDHADDFDIKKRGMMPLTDSARVLCLQHGIRDVYSTTGRFRALQSVEPKHADLMVEAAQSYEIMMKYRAKSGLRHHDSGRFIELGELNKLEKHILKNAFQPIRELQDILEVRFNLAYFN